MRSECGRSPPSAEEAGCAPDAVHPAATACRAFDETQYGYNSAKQRNRTVSPGGTINFDVLDVRGNVIRHYEGTDDSGATEDDPTGGAADPNNIETINRKRYHNAPASQTGPLGDPSTSPKARVTYTAHWHDGVGREIAMADYGTNGGTALVRPDTIPDCSDTVLVTTTAYDDAGDAFQKIDPAGKEDQTTPPTAGNRTTARSM